jgi:hypothetical protein
VLVAVGDVNADGSADALVERKQHRGLLTEVFEGKGLVSSQVVLLETVILSA